MHPTYPTKCAYVEPKVEECKPLVPGLPEGDRPRGVLGSNGRVMQVETSVESDGFGVSALEINM
jgi:hypothetical protein